jgi:hypothetical protein
MFHIFLERSLRPTICSLLSSQRSIPVVFNCVLSAPLNALGDVGPVVAQLLVCGNELRLLGGVPGIALDVRAQLVVPPLAALLADAAWKATGNKAPVAFAVLLDQPAIVLGRGAVMTADQRGWKTKGHPSHY